MPHFVHMKVVARVEGATSFQDAERLAEHAVGKFYFSEHEKSLSINKADAEVITHRTGWEKGV